MKLQELISDIALLKEVGAKDFEINKIEFDSRKIERNDLFVAVKGTQVDGHSYISQAINSGAIAIVLEQLPAQFVAGVTYLQVANSAEALGLMATRYFDFPIQGVATCGNNRNKWEKNNVGNLIIRTVFPFGIQMWPAFHD